MPTHQILSKCRHLTLILRISLDNMTDKKASQDYINTAKSLLLLLACVDQTDQKRMKLISMLFPLLPAKFRYTLEKLGRKLCFERSEFFCNCKSAKLSSHHFETIQKLTPQLMVDERSSLHSTMIDSASQDRILLEDLQKILSISAKAGIDPSHFFVLLPERHLRKAQAINNEIAKEKDLMKTGKKSLQKKGEECINHALFQRSRPNAFRPTNSEQLEEAETKDMTASLSKAKAIYLEKKNRVMAQQNHHKDNKRVSKQTTTVAPKRVRKSNVDEVEKSINQVKNDVYQPRIDRLNGKIKANVPKSFTCSLCNTHAKEVNIWCYNMS